MAQLYLLRDTKVYLKIGTGVWEIPVLDGFSFSQATNSSEVTLSEMEASDGTSRRAKKQFNDSLAPAEWSFTTYVRPFASTAPTEGAADTVAGNVHAVEEALWAIMAGPAYYEGSTFKTATGGTAYFTQGTDSVTIDFNQSNRSILGEAHTTPPSLIFRVGDANYKYYELTGVVVNEATANFEIDGIASIEWSGMGAQLQETTAPTATVFEAITDTGNFIRNRLTQMTIVPNMASGIYNTADVETAGYNITLTGGSITISNNMSFITPEELGLVNYPIGHVTGTRSISGSFMCYLVYDGGATDNSSDFWEDMSGLTSIVTHNFDLTFTVGGNNYPALEFNFPQAHVEIPTHSIEDVISLETNFNALPTSLDETNELTITYKAQ
jgi:hypothetical protein